MKRFSHSPSSRQEVIYFTKEQDYATVLKLQREFFRERAEGRRPDTFIVGEHHPVFTLGRRGLPEHSGDHGLLLKQQGFEVHEIERGGAVTYHGPGQIVGYPILRLREYCPGPKMYVEQLEEVMIRVLGEWGIYATRLAKLPGVWVPHDESPLTPTLSPQRGEGVREEPPPASSPPLEGRGEGERPPIQSSPPFGGRGEGEGGNLLENFKKIGAVGVRISRGVTLHGFSLNVNVDLKPFELITPCGIEGCQVTSMEKVLHKSIDMDLVRQQILYHFGEVFGLVWKEGLRMKSEGI